MSKSHTFEIEHKNGVYTCQLVPDGRCKSVIIRVEPSEDGSCLIGPNTFKGNLFHADQAALFPEYKPGRAYVVKVTYPMRVARRDVIKSIIEHSKWIEDEMSRLQTRSVGFSRRILTNGTLIPFNGHYLTLCILTSKPGAPQVVETKTALICHTDTIAQKELRNLIEKWFRRRTMKLIQERIDRLAVGVTDKHYKVSVRAQRTRWGSCSQNGSLSFNWKLAMLPDYVLDYIIVHELAHLEEFNHSSRFWSIVKEKCKHVTRAKLWLKKHGPELE